MSLGDGAPEAEAGAVTRDKDFKRLVRARTAATGERYTTARAALLRPGKEDAMIPVTVKVRVQTLTEEEAAERAEKYVGVHVERQGEPEVAFAGWRQEDREQPWLILTEVDASRELLIAVGPVGATAVAFALKGVKTQRPMTHDMLRDVVAIMGEAREVRVTELKEDTFFAELLVVDSAGQERTVSCRPSDGIALAVRADIPILVAESLFPEASTAAER